jgi:hypothetical protein
MSKYDYSQVTSEISGFGGDYEECCRAMVVGGCEWLDAHPEVKPKFSHYRNIVGVVLDDNDDAKAMVKAMVDACEAFRPGAGGPTGAMMQFTVHHVLQIREHGWNWYLEQMNQPERAREAAAHYERERFDTRRGEERKT